MFYFSVVIITHDREKELFNCLNSLRPGYKNWDLLILANGKKLSQEIINYALSINEKTKFLSSEFKLLPGAARNFLITQTESEWIFFIDDDCYVLPGYWEKVYQYLQNPAVDILGGPDTMAINESTFSTSLSLVLSSPFCTGPTYPRHTPVGKQLVLADEKKITSCNLWIRKKVIEGHTFPENFKRAEEIHLLKILKSEGKKIYYAPDLFVGHFRRKNFNALIKPTFFAGYYRSLSARQFNGDNSLFFWLPSIFVLLHTLLSSLIHFYFCI